MKIKNWIALGFLAGFSSLSAQKSLSLQEAIQFGLENNPQAKISDFDLELARKKVKETAAIGLPQVSADISYNNFIDIPVQVAPGAAFGQPNVEFIELEFGTQHTGGANLTASQLLFSGSYLVGLKASKTYVKMAEYQKGLTDVNLKHDIASAYHLVLLAQESVKVTEQSLEKMSTAFEETTALFENGFIDESSVDELQLSKLSLENTLVQVKNQVKTAELLLKLQLGLSISEEIVLTSTLETLLEKKTALTQFNPNNNIQYGMLETKESLQTLNLYNQKAALLPTVAAFYNHQQNAYRNDFSFFDADGKYYPTNLIGLKMSVPIFTSGGTTSKINQAKIELAKVDEEKRQLEIGLALQYQEAINNLIIAEQSLDLVKRKITLGEGILDKAYVNHKEGLISSFELNEKESRFLQLQSEHLQALMKVLNAQLAIDKLQSTK
jgi:outer membrane protein TolC